MGISIPQLKATAKQRLKDSEKLFEARRYHSALYMSGYAVELALKARICKTLHWQQFPENRGECQIFKSFHSHDLDLLLQVSGIEGKIKTVQNLPDWSAIVSGSGSMAGWNPENRYRTSTPNKVDTRSRLDSVNKIVRIILS